MKLIALLMVKVLLFACARENNTTSIPIIGPTKALIGKSPVPKNEKVSFDQLRRRNLHLKDVVCGLKPIER